MASPATLAIPSALAWAHPVVAEWFVRRFGTPTEPQIAGWPHIVAEGETAQVIEMPAEVLQKASLHRELFQ